MVKEEAVLYLETLTCIKENDAGKGDEIYLWIYVDGDTEGMRYPMGNDMLSMGSGTTKSVDMAINVTVMSTVVVRIFDWDSVGHDSDDYGTITISRESMVNNPDGYQEVEQYDGGAQYRLDYRLFTNPVPAVRLLAIRCEKQSAGMDVEHSQAVADAASSCYEAAANVIELSPRPSREIIAAAFNAASVIIQGIEELVEWLMKLIEGEDDVYMVHVANVADVANESTRGYGGGFFPPSESTHQMTDGDEFYFQKEYGQYFRFPLDTGPVTIQFKEHDTVKGDINIGTLTITPDNLAEGSNAGISGTTVNGGVAVMGGPAVVEIADSYGEREGEGAVYHLCYSIGMEDWALPATTDEQSSTDGTVSAGHDTDLDDLALPLYYTLPEDKTPEDIVGFGAHKDGAFNVWFKDRTVCSGTAYELDQDGPAVPYTLPSGKNPEDIVGMGIAANGYCYVWFKSGQVCAGTKTDLDSYKGLYNCVLPSDQTPADIVGIALTSNDKSHYWFKDKRVCSGSTKDANDYSKGYSDYTLASGKKIEDVIDMGYGPGDHCFVWYRGKPAT